LDSFELDNHKSALTCHAAGASLYFRAPAELERNFVTAMSNAVGMNFAAMYPNGTLSVYLAVIMSMTGYDHVRWSNIGDPRGEIETFISRKGHVTDWHFDFMENFTFQLRGSKTWKMKRSTIPHPLRGCTPHYKTADVFEQQVCPIE
jgi:hypothetical protein